LADVLFGKLGLKAPGGRKTWRPAKHPPRRGRNWNRCGGSIPSSSCILEQRQLSKLKKHLF